MNDEPIGETDRSLLNNAKEYLRQRIDDALPGTLLSQAWDTFFNMYDDLVRRYAKSMGVLDRDIDDVTQEVWIRIVMNITEFERPKDQPGLRAWLFTVVRSAVQDELRKAMRHPVSDSNLVGEVVDSDAEDGEDHANSSQWQTAVVESALEQMKEDIGETNHEILVRRLVLRESTGTVAEAVSMTKEQVRYRQHRGLKKLKRYLAVYKGLPIGELDEMQFADD